MQSFKKMPVEPAKEHDLFFLSASSGLTEEIIKLEPNIPVAKMKDLVGQDNNCQTGLSCTCLAQGKCFCSGVDKYTLIKDCIIKMEIYARLTVSTVECGCPAKGLHILKIKADAESQHKKRLSLLLARFPRCAECLANSVTSPIHYFYFLFFAWAVLQYEVCRAEILEGKKNNPSLQGNLNSKLNLDLMMFAGLLCSFSLYVLVLQASS